VVPIAEDLSEFLNGDCIILRLLLLLNAEKRPIENFEFDAFEKNLLEKSFNEEI
jgi:hypothetical protein